MDSILKLVVVDIICGGGAIAIPVIGRAARVEERTMSEFQIMMLILVAFAALVAISGVISAADKARRARAERERRDQQWRHL